MTYYLLFKGLYFHFCHFGLQRIVNNRFGSESMQAAIIKILFQAKSQMLSSTGFKEQD